MSSEAIPGGAYGVDVVMKYLVPGRPFKGATYRNIILSSTDPTIVDDIKARSVLKFITIDWPGGSPEHGYNLETILVNSPHKPSSSEVGAEVTRTRNAILSAYVGEAALNRVPHEVKAYWKAGEEAYPGVEVIDLLKVASAQHGLPLSACLTSEIVGGDPDARILHFLHPDTISPEPVLTELQLGVVNAIASEIPYFRTGA